MKIPIISPIIRIVAKIITVVIWLVTFASAYGGSTDPQYFTLPAILCLLLPYLAILSAILIIAWLCGGRFIFAAIGAFLLFIPSSHILTAVPFGHSRSAADDSRTFSIMSWNVIHTEDLRNPDFPTNRAVEYMLSSGADIITLAELNDFSATELKKATPEQRDSLFAIYPYKGGGNNTDIKILSKYPVKEIPVETSITNRHPFSFFSVKMPQGEITVAMVHLHSYNLTDEERQVVTDIKSINSAKSSVKEFKGSIFAKMRTAFRLRGEEAAELRAQINKTEGPLIVCGDFNDVPDSWTYRLVRGEDMHDAYIETNFGPAITYNLHLFYFHIDQMLYRGDLKALSLRIGKIKTSDHYPLIGTFEIKN